MSGSFARSRRLKMMTARAAMIAPTILERVNRGLDIARFLMPGAQRSTPTGEAQFSLSLTVGGRAFDVGRCWSLHYDRLALGHHQDVVMDAGLFCACEQAGEGLI